MPGQVDSSTSELLLVAPQERQLDGAVVEVLWLDTPGEHKNASHDFGTIHSAVSELLTQAPNEGYLSGSVVEFLYNVPGEFVQEGQLDGASLEVLWLDVPGEHKNASGDFGTIHGSVAELLFVTQSLGNITGSVAELLTIADATVVAIVPNISGPPLVPIQFDGSGSSGSILQYRWSWTSVPGGSTIGNLAQPYPNFGGTTPIDMTSNVVLYHAEETAGVSGFDTSGSGNTATLNTVTPGVVGHVGSYAWNFTVSSSYVAPGTPIPMASNYTIALWFFNLAPNSAWRTATRGTVSDHQIIVENGGDRLGAYLSGGFRPVVPQFDMPVGTYAGWHHIAVVGSGTEQRFYVDGVFRGAIAFKSAENVHYIGNYSSFNQRFADRIDEFAIWDRALSRSEISDLYILQEGSYAGVEDTLTFTPDLLGTYTIDLTVVSQVDLSTSTDSADAEIVAGGLKFPLQGDNIRMWGYLQGGNLRNRDED